jgi:predicted GIY-YIG superfamily endonuclease
MNWQKNYSIDWKIIYTESFGEKKLAMKREKELKSARGRIKKSG